MVLIAVDPMGSSIRSQEFKQNTLRVVVLCGLSRVGIGGRDFSYKRPKQTERSFYSSKKEKKRE